MISLAAKRPVRSLHISLKDVLKTRVIRLHTAHAGEVKDGHGVSGKTWRGP